MNLADTANMVRTTLDSIYKNGKYHSDTRKKKLMVEVWNSQIGQRANEVDDNRLKCIYLSYMGMITKTISDELTSEELYFYMNIILDEMENSMFNSERKGE